MKYIKLTLKADPKARKIAVNTEKIIAFWDSGERYSTVQIQVNERDVNTIYVSESVDDIFDLLNK